MPVVRLVCYLLAFACFVATALGTAVPKVSLLPAGLAFATFPSLLAAVQAVE